MSKYHLYLLAAIACEVAATTALARSDGFTRLWPSLIAVAGYALAFWLLSFPLRTMPTGIVYAIWSGVGLVGISLVGWRIYGERLNAGAFVGLGLIGAGVVVLQLHGRSGH